MEAVNQANLALQLPHFKFDGKNRQEFRRNWPQVARHYHIQGIVDGTEARPIGGDDVAEAQAAWDQLNQLALDKLKYFVSDSIHAIVWKGQDDLTARDYYHRMATLLLRTSVRSVVKLEKVLNNAHRTHGMKLLEWMCTLDNIFVEFVAAGKPKLDAAMKAHAMSKVGRDLEAIATFLGQDEGVTYVQWQAAILEKEREMEETGQIMVQGLAHQLSTNRRNFEGEGGDGAFATTVQQSWRGSGRFLRGGRIGGRYPWRGRHPITTFTQGRSTGTYNN